MPSTLDEIMEEQNSLKTEIDLLENKIIQQGQDIYTDLKKATTVQIDRDVDLSQKTKDDSEHMKSELTEKWVHELIKNGN